MRAALTGVLVVAFIASVEAQQVPELAAARVAAHTEFAESAERWNTAGYIAVGAVVGAATWIAVGHGLHTVFRDTCETLNGLGARCRKPNYVKLGLLGAASGAVAGVIIAKRRGERGGGARTRVAPVAHPDGIALQLVFR